MFFWNSFAFSMIQRMLAIWSLVPLPFLNPGWTSESFTVHILLKPGLENFEHYFASMWDECNYAVVWAFFGIAFLWDWNVNWHFPVLWPLLSFPHLLARWVHIGHLPSWGLVFCCHIFLTFHTACEVLAARILERLAIPSSSGQHFVRTLRYDLSVLGGPAWHGS